MQNNMELIYREDVLFLLDDAISCIKEEVAEANDEMLKSILNSIANMYTKTRTIIIGVPSVDAEPVRHAKWEYKCYPTIWYGPGEPPEWICSECQDRAYDTYDYCPNCGARMDAKE